MRNLSERSDALGTSGSDHNGPDVMVAFSQWSAVNHLHSGAPQTTVTNNNTHNSGYSEPHDLNAS